MTDREKLIELIAEAKSSMMDRRGLMCELARNSHIADRLISNGVVIREKGEWKTEDYDGGDLGYYAAYLEVSCKQCGLSVGVEQGQYDWYYGEPFPWNFCPNCGADMR